MLYLCARFCFEQINSIISLFPDPSIAGAPSVFHHLHVSRSSALCGGTHPEGASADQPRSVHRSVCHASAIVAWRAAPTDSGQQLQTGRSKIDQYLVRYFSHFVDALQPEGRCLKIFADYIVFSRQECFLMIQHSWNVLCRRSKSLKTLHVIL